MTGGGALYWQDDSRGRTALDCALAGDAPDREPILRRLQRPVIEDADFAAAVAALHAGDLAALSATQSGGQHDIERVSRPARLAARWAGLLCQDAQARRRPCSSW